MRLAVDGTNLAHDRRGMGRVARAALAVLAADPRIALTLVLEERAVGAVGREFPDVPLVRPAALRRRGAFDAAWYPFNGMRVLARAPAVVTVHDAFAVSDPARGRTARAREIGPIRRAVEHAVRIATVSAFSRDEIARAFAVTHERIVVVPPAPDRFFSPGVGAELPAALVGRPYVLVVAGPERRKNLALFFAAAAVALRGRPEILVVVGELSVADARRLAAPGMRYLRLRATDATLRSLYREAAVVAVPSRAEGFGMAAAEAAACGAAIAAADAGALPETLAGCASFVDPRDVRAWTATLRAILDDPDLAAGLRARAAARYAFSPRGGYADAMCDLLLAVAAGR